MAKLAKKYIKAAGGINKKAWAMQRAANGKKGKGKPKSKSKSKSKSSGGRRMAKKSMFSNKYVLGAALAIGATFAARSFGMNPSVARLGVGLATGNPIIAGYELGNMIQAQGGLFTGGGLLGGGNNVLVGAL